MWRKTWPGGMLLRQLEPLEVWLCINGRLVTSAILCNMRLPSGMEKPHACYVMHESLVLVFKDNL
jgi:hypothetical protein